MTTKVFDSRASGAQWGTLEFEKNQVKMCKKPTQCDVNSCSACSEVLVNIKDSLISNSS